MNKNKDNEIVYNNLKIDCEKCFGFCCVALYFSKSEGFPTDKVAGKPCINLQEDFKCTVHKNLSKKGLKGCTGYDCFGAGQKVAQDTYEKVNWRENPNSKNEMLDVFLVMRQLHEMLWYLTEAYRMQNDEAMKNKINNMINETIKITNLDAKTLLKLDLIMHRHKVNELLLKTSKIIREKNSKGKKNNLKGKKAIAGRPNYIGADLRKFDLRGEDLSGALLIAANLSGCDLSGVDFIGADMRDTDIRNANLTNSIYITQMQINAAKGDVSTKLPENLTIPSHWEKS